MKTAKRLTTSVTLMLMLSTAMVAASDYKTPANMTNDDRRTLMAGSSEYERCVAGNLHELAPRIGDPRALADAAMASCNDTLTAFAQKMAAENYHPDFSNYYIGRVRARVANTAVQQAMFFASQNQSQDVQNPQADNPQQSAAPSSE